jgi:hypothetical protein
VQVQRDEYGTWTVEPTDDERQQKPDYVNALPRYLTTFDAVLAAAETRNAFEFLHTLLGFRGAQDAGWVPYENTLRAISSVTQVHNELDDSTAAWHLALWVYGHIVEAAEPYEILANLIAISQGGRFNVRRFHDRRSRPQSPGEKIGQIEASAAEAGLSEAAFPLREIWDRDLRNSIFHADYVLHSSGVRLPSARNPTRDIETVRRLVGRAHAYHDSVAELRRLYLGSYEEPKEIPAGEGFGGPEERAVVIVRQGEGAVGLKHAYRASEVEQGAIPWRMAVLLPGDRELLDADPELALLPPRPPPPVAPG